MSDDIMKPLEAMKLHTIKGIGGRTSTMSQVSYDHEMELLAQRQAEGRYTLEEAAMAVRDGAGEDGEELLKELERAAKAGELVVHRPGQRLPVKSDHVKQWSDEAYFDDLNDWLAKNMKRITWRFAAPASQNVGDDEAASETPQERKDRLRKRCNELKSQKVRAWKAQVAKEEGISPQRLHDLINEKKPKSKKASAPDWFK